MDIFIEKKITATVVFQYKYACLVIESTGLADML